VAAIIPSAWLVRIKLKWMATTRKASSSSFTWP
jgi:hypothetical protein